MKPYCLINQKNPMSPKVAALVFDKVELYLCYILEPVNTSAVTTG
jgi:hypothetical protein